MVGMSTLPDTKSGGPLNDGVPFRHPDPLDWGHQVSRTEVLVNAVARRIKLKPYLVSNT